MANKPKLLILQSVITAYRVPIFNILTEHFDVTIGYYIQGNPIEGCKFAQEKLDSYKFGPFICIKSLRKYCAQFDAVIFSNNLRIPSYCMLPFGGHKYKTIAWGIGMRASRTRLYNVNRRHTLLDKIYQFITSCSDASVFYMDKSKEFWKDTSFDLSRVFVAPNTTAVENVVIDPSSKKNLLFVGTLYKGKGLDTLIDMYKKAMDNMQTPPMLHIVGGGSEEQSLKQYVEDCGLSNYVVFHGAIFDETILAKHFQNALLCISPHQAGLSVVKSMGYGVPFVTHKDAITGGEKYHITHEKNGLLYENDEDLVQIIVDASNNPEKYIEMGQAAKDYYDSSATPRHMAQGIIDAVNFVMGK